MVEYEIYYLVSLLSFCFLSVHICISWYWFRNALKCSCMHVVPVLAHIQDRICLLSVQCRLTEINRVLIIPALKELWGGFTCWSALQEAAPAILVFLRVCVSHPDPAVPVGLSVAKPLVVRWWLPGGGDNLPSARMPGREHGAGVGRVKATLSSSWHEFSHGIKIFFSKQQWRKSLMGKKRCWYSLIFSSIPPVWIPL